MTNELSDVFEGPTSISGTPLAEVFSIFVNTNGNKLELYGRVTIEDDKGTFHIYNVEPKNAESIDQSGVLSLSNNTRAISASACRFTVKLDLTEKNENGDSEFIKTSFTWVEDDIDSYDKCLEQHVEGKLGWATVSYTVHSVAEEAIIFAYVSEGRFSGALDVYGSIKACYKNQYIDASTEIEYSRMTLLEYIDDPVEMEHDDSFPLERSVVSVPCFSSLSIEVDFGCQLPGGAEVENVWRAKANFIPGSIKAVKIEGQYGVIKLGVLFLNYYVQRWQGLEYWRPTVEFIVRNAET